MRLAALTLLIAVGKVFLTWEYLEVARDLPEKVTIKKKILQESLDCSLFHSNPNPGSETRHWEASEVRDVEEIFEKSPYRLSARFPCAKQGWLLCETWEKEQGQIRKDPQTDRAAELVRLWPVSPGQFAYVLGNER